MRRRLAVFASAAVAVFAVTGPGSASAAVEFGDTCSANEGTGPATLTTLSAPAGGLPLTAPSGGVVTKVMMRIGVPLPFLLPQQVKILRSAGGNNFTTIEQTTIQAGFGLTTADARMPIQAGDRLGLHGPPFSFEGSPIEGFEVYCKNQPGARVGGISGDVPVGSTATFMEGPPDTRIPLAAIVEPDADNDGYGDETQDGCPQSAALQVACPVVTLDAVGQPGATSVVVLVATSIASPVSVKGTVDLGKGRKTSLKAGPKTVTPGKLTRFRLKFNAKLQQRLKELEPGRKLTLKITASGTNVAGQVSTDKVKTKLKGQA